jgi:uncharacterized integral membrane protein
MNTDPNSASIKPTRPSHNRGLLWAVLLIGILIVMLLIAYAAAHAGKIFVRPDWARKLGLPSATLQGVYR